MRYKLMHYKSKCDGRDFLVPKRKQVTALSNPVNIRKSNTSSLFIFILLIIFIISSCSFGNMRSDKQLHNYDDLDIAQICDVDSLHSIIFEKNQYIDNLYSTIEFLTMSVDSLRSELEFRSSRIFINDSFEIPFKYSFAGVEIDLSNDRIRNKLQGIYNAEVRRAHQFIPRSGIYFDIFDSIFEQYDIHPDVKYIAVIESNLSSMAMSQARAGGIWQIIPSTARNLNLTINSYVDERRNVFKATDAASRYLIQAHKQLNALNVDDWLVTLASYNAGVGGISRAVREQQGRDFASLIMRVDETNNYIWRAIATKMIFEFEELIFDEPFERMTPLLETANLVTVELRGYHDLADWASAKGSSARIIWELNPWIDMSRTRSGRYSVINHLILPPGVYEILVPIDAEPDLEKLATAERALAVRNNAPFITGNASQHRVQRGETLSSIARRYNVSINDIRRWNNLRGDTIYAGQTLNLQATQSSSSSSSNTSSSSSTSSTRSYTVQSGDTISSIARRLGVTQAHLLSRNNLQATSIIRPGQVLQY